VTVSLTALIFVNANAQVIAEDSKGGNFLIGFLDGVVRGNVSDASLGAGYSINFPRAALDFGLTGKASNGVSGIVATGELTPGTKIHLGLSYNFTHDNRNVQFKADELTKKKVVLQERQAREEQSEIDADKKKKIKARYEAKYKEIDKKIEQLLDYRDEVNLKAGIALEYENSLYRLLDFSQTFSEQVTKEEFKSGSIQPYVTAYIPDINLLLSLIVTYHRTNNIDDLEKKTLTTIRESKDPTQTRTHQTKSDNTVWEGSYEAFPATNVGLGGLFQPFETIPVGLLFYFRENWWSDSQSQKFLNAGIGISMLSTETLFTPTVGLMIEYSGQKTEDNPDGSFENGISVNLVTSLPFTLEF